MDNDFFTEEEIEIIKTIFDIVRYEEIGAKKLVKKTEIKLNKIVNGEKHDDNRKEKELLSKISDIDLNKEKKKQELTRLRDALISVRNKKIKEQEKEKTRKEEEKKNKIKSEKITLNTNLQLKIRRAIACIQGNLKDHEDYVLKFLNYYGYDYSYFPFKLYAQIFLICFNEDGKINRESWKTLKAYMEKNNMLEENNKKGSKK